jgi:hypothetical protein
MKLPIIISMTGASGQVYAIRLVQVLAELQQSMHLVVSDASRLVIREEMKLDIPMQGSPVEFLWGKTMTSISPVVRIVRGGWLSVPAVPGPWVRSRMGSPVTWLNAQRKLSSKNGGN